MFSIAANIDPSATGPCPACRRGIRIPARLAARVLGGVLLATGAPATTAASPLAELLDGARPEASEFHSTSDFQLQQNTILLNASSGDGSPPRLFIVDSGAPMTIAAALARELRLATSASVALAGPAGGHSVVPVTRLPQLRIAGLNFADVGAVVAWVEPPDELACLSRAGLLGASLLQAAIWQIDFHSRRITMTSALDTLPGLGQATRIPFIRADAAGSPRIAVGVSELQQASLLIDLGFNGSLAIPTALLEQAGDRVSATAPVETGQAAATVLGNRRSEVRIARVGELRLGDLRLPDFPVMTGPGVSDFHLGIEFLRHFRVTIDWQHDDLYLEPQAPQADLYFDYASYGFAPKLGNHGLEVGAIWSGGAAERAGLALGDRLVAIDGRDTSDPGFAEFCGLLDAVGLFGWQDAPIAVTRLRAGERETFRLTRSPPGPAGVAD
ncbi:MAG: aspartyl protease family protein [Pseudomonadales bacterium]|nr:aspartyl protease family protein [Halieaceae bacterium]MCP5189915.1 aspartyl protease family protein [Pseudomonadales bacterium]MCP5203476.1 aspartyl protease family protein [Pseudomonadales bacterium]